MFINFEFKEGNERLSSHSGLALIGALLNRTSMKDRLNSLALAGCLEPKISHFDVIRLCGQESLREQWQYRENACPPTKGKTETYPYCNAGSNLHSWQSYPSQENGFFHLVATATGKKFGKTFMLGSWLQYNSFIIFNHRMLLT